MRKILREHYNLASKKTKGAFMALFCIFLIPILQLSAQSSGRQTISLNGIWQIGESADSINPSVFNHTIIVPGLVNLAKPAFAEAGKFISREVANHPLYKNPELPKEAATAPVGISLQKRNYFWYRRNFKASAKRGVAILKINKAQFGTDVWLNGTRIGKHNGCFTAGYFNLTNAIKWSDDNILEVRIGAHPGILPPTVPAGTDLEKFEWMPGIYDEVSVSFMDNPVIESIQVAPRINTSEIVVQTVVKNYMAQSCSFQLVHKVNLWKKDADAGHSLPADLTLVAGEERTITQMISIPDAKLWSPENPFLYEIKSSTGGDSHSTRFGMREFHFDRATGWGYLNNKPYFLRGANITLHRFFEDAHCGALPWNEKWVRKLLVEIPKQMNWNSFRFCIGPVPDFWLEVADEAGLLISNEFFLWVPGPSWKHSEWDLIPQYSEWLKDNWNHPSVAIWDACNESRYVGLSEKVVPAVRRLDLSNRPWQLSNNPPVDPDDPVERHLYVLPDNDSAHTSFDWTYFERPPRIRQYPNGNPPGIVNEYGEFWLNRDGSPTTLTDFRFKNFIAGPNASAEERFEAAAYYLAGETEYHRAYRKWAGVQHFTYLTSSYAGGYTSDNFRDVENLVLDPWFKDYMGEAFQPLGVNLSFWRPAVKADSTYRIKIMMVNDYPGNMNGKLVLSIYDESGKELAKSGATFDVEALGQHEYEINFHFPKVSGKCFMKATAYPSKNRFTDSPTVSRRKIIVN